MHRRNMLTAAVATIGAIFAAASKAARAAPDMPEKSKVVYHLTDFDKVNFVLGNIKNHYEGVGGPDKVTIALVVHGSALKAFHTASATPWTVHETSEFLKSGLQLNACGNTMRSQNVSLKDLVPGFVVAERGGVVRIAELQSQGYLYLRP
ncbi:MAG: DsrE family protein [Xanthobacteraceae bacterium]|nr:DsrE family protein [Xanthobacteraceae bacterium]